METGEFYYELNWIDETSSSQLETVQYRLSTTLNPAGQCEGGTVKQRLAVAENLRANLERCLRVGSLALYTCRAAVCERNMR